MEISKEIRHSYEDKALEIVNSLSLEEKVYLMSGRMSIEEMMLSKNTPGGHYNVIPYPAGGNDTHGIPPVLFCDGPRGVVCGTGKSTCFPVSMLRGASFDTDLEEEIGAAIGREIRGFGGNLFGGVCINLPYHPGWGRSQETYGEDSFLLGKFGAALTRGVQSEHVTACVKHYAFNSMEISRFTCSVECDRRTEREVYLPHFKDCIDAGAACVMTSYNKYCGTYCGHSDYLLNKILKEEWDFDGFTISDFFFGVKDTVEAANGGQDIVMCHTKYYGQKLIKAVINGQVAMKKIDDTALRIVRTMLAFHNARLNDGRSYNETVIGCQDHRNLALKSAQEGITLLQNTDQILPFNRSIHKKLLVLGKLGINDNIGDYGSSRVYSAYNISVMDGLQALLPNHEITYYDGTDPQFAAFLSAQADAVIFVVGFDHDDEGEYVSPNQSSCYTAARGGDRIHGLGLHPDEVRLIQIAGPVNKASAVILIGGGTITVTEWKDSVSSILMAYYPGQEGGKAIAQILFGDVNPSGRLPFVVPVHDEDLPSINWETESQYYEYLHGYRKLDYEAVRPLFPFGFGLSYTTFCYQNACFSVDCSTIIANVTITNTGTSYGTTTVQLYAGFSHSRIFRPVKTLVGFKRVDLEAGEVKAIEIKASADRLKWYNKTTGIWELEHMEYDMYIGTSSDMESLLAGTIRL